MELEETDTTTKAIKSDILKLHYKKIQNSDDSFQVIYN